MRNCGLYCIDCGCDIEYTDEVVDGGYMIPENNYYCHKCKEYKDDDKVISPKPVPMYDNYD